MGRAVITVDTRDSAGRIRETHAGTAEPRPGGVVLAYTETGESGLEGEVEIAARPGEIVVTRRGNVCMTQRLALGLPTVFTYSTPHGDFDVRVDTGKLHTQFKPSGGRLWAEYRLLSGGEPESRTMEIKYTFTKDGKDRGL